MGQKSKIETVACAEQYENKISTKKQIQVLVNRIFGLTTAPCRPHNSPTHTTPQTPPHYTCITQAAVAPLPHRLLERIRLFHFIFPASVSSLLFVLMPLGNPNMEIERGGGRSGYHHTVRRTHKPKHKRLCQVDNGSGPGYRTPRTVTTSCQVPLMYHLPFHWCTDKGDFRTFKY